MEVCEKMQADGELQPYELGAGDVKDLFGEVWEALYNNGDMNKNVIKWF
jgi:hypothetical protein